MKRTLIITVLLAMAMPLLAGDSEVSEIQKLRTENAELTAKIIELNETIKRLNENNQKLAQVNAELKKELESRPPAADAVKSTAKVKRGTVEALNADLHAAGYDLKEKKTYTPEQLAVIKATAEAWVGKPITAGPSLAYGITGSTRVDGQECTRRKLNLSDCTQVQYWLDVPTTKRRVPNQPYKRLVYAIDDTRQYIWQGTVHSVTVNENGVEICILLKKLEKAE